MSPDLKRLSDERSSGEGDPHGLKIVRNALQLRTGGRQHIRSQNQKQLNRLGDQLSIALLKILNETDFADPALTLDLLPIVRDSFQYPQFITRVEDRVPSVTLFLLNFLKENSSDVAIKAEIQRTIDFVKQQTS
jgi:hypothetical protein